MTRKTVFFEGWSWFELNNLGKALDKNWKFYTSVAKTKRVKTESQKDFGLNSYICRNHRGKTGRGLFAPIILNRVDEGSGLIVEIIESQH